MHNASRSIVRALQTAREYEIKARTPGLSLGDYRNYSLWATQLRKKAKSLYDQATTSNTAKRRERRTHRATT